LSKIARRKFIQLSAVAAAGVLAQPGRSAKAEDMPKLSEDDPMAQGMKYTHDASELCQLRTRAGRRPGWMAGVPDLPGQARQRERMVQRLGAQSLTTNCLSIETPALSRRFLLQFRMRRD
jgi:hypothetical protein